MTLKLNGYNKAAVSLIEIMMIFAIIGIVTTACLGLSKPKYEYMKKIKLYSVFEMLENAGKIIANEGHIDYTTDINTCNNRAASNICLDYSGRYPNMNNQLPKVVARDAFFSIYHDPGLNNVSGYNAIYTTLNQTERNQYIYLQNGLCQRIASALGLSDVNAHCPQGESSVSLIEDSASYQVDFSSKSPHLYLPNGIVLYFGKNLYNDYQNYDLNLSHNIVLASPEATVNSYSNNLSYDDIKGSYLEPETNGGDGYDFSDECFNMSSSTSSNNNGYLFMPNESRLAAITNENLDMSDYDYNDDLLKYLKQIWKKNKDYFHIYVDINGKMADNSDKKCGPDRLNEDIFLFRMYRDGTVIPDYRSGFPLKYLTAKVLVQDDNDAKGKFKTYSNSVDLRTYAVRPLVFARCYANMAGSYASGYNYDHMGICTYGATGNSSNGIKPLNVCVGANGESRCKVIVNKPSFLMR